jgi:hypothetical protein
MRRKKAQSQSSGEPQKSIALLNVRAEETEEEVERMRDWICEKIEEQHQQRSLLNTALSGEAPE